MDTLRDLLRQEVGARAIDLKLAIDLKHVSLVDREAVQFPALTEYNGTELGNCPAYVREWVHPREGGNARGAAGPATGVKASMMFERDHDGFNQFADEGVGRRNAIYELIGASPNFIAAPSVLNTSRLICE